MRYQGTAVQIYDMPVSLDSNVRFDKRMSMLVSTIGMLGLGVFLAFLVLGIVAQRL